MNQTDQPHRSLEEEGAGQARSVPERTCVGCRQADSDDVLERFVYIEDQGLIFDVRQKAPGRGVYVHPRLDCVGNAVKRKGFARALKRQVPGLELEALIAMMSQGIERRLQESLQVSVRASKVAVGQTKVAEAVKADKACVMLLASDSSEGSRKKFSSNADRKGVAVRDRFTGAQLGSFAGRDFVGVLVITDDALGGRVIADIERLRELSGDEG